MSDIPAHHAAPTAPLLIDLFCQVVDNYGDIGVCWRLARRLTQNTPHHVRLWVDNLVAFRRLEPQVDTSGCQALTDQITVWHWERINQVKLAGDVVIEAFGCELPDAFLPLMLEKNSLWINLEYLSAENWVNDCHQMPSLQPNGLRKYFFFPGFTPATGGLLREPTLLEQRDEWLATPHARWHQLQELGVPAELNSILQRGARQVFLFNYPDAPTQALIRALSNDSRPTVILQPKEGATRISKLTPNVDQVEIPFVPQVHFDSLLWGSDLNLVRGEDSLVRAMWAGKPFLWHIYRQDNDSHLIKLNAWLDKSPFEVGIKQLQIDWNRGELAGCEDAFNDLLNHPGKWRNWHQSCRSWASKLARQPDLATNLLFFFTRHSGTR
ncbi:MAG TPA: elongation factor P maturation arginine rhamnosyltransferase EarP [Pusillimonas sp.]|jgi:uncharacterized repeat protein (TIGR03837 family)|nr:elongation factor P maturation arginine rhamnosyltransferase EarP [Pusillimonas sp.]|tara:strand:- start:12819 stop:13964 length:1146 start_codon:yes stop_codon:yes gene_type:complete